MKQKTTLLPVPDLIDANSQLKKFKETKAHIKFNVTMKERDPNLCPFSDTSFNITAFQSYGQTGIVTGLELGANRERRIFHPINFNSSKQRSVSYSSYGA